MMVSLYVQSFMDKFPLKIVFFNPFLYWNVCDTLLQMNNVLQLIIDSITYAWLVIINILGMFT